MHRSANATGGSSRPVERKVAVLGSSKKGERNVPVVGSSGIESNVAGKRKREQVDDNEELARIARMLVKASEILGQIVNVRTVQVHIMRKYVRISV